MKFENLYIKCESMEQRNIVIAIALKNGYQRYCADDNDQNVVMSDNGRVFDLNWAYADQTEVYQKLTYSEFSEKFSEVKLLEKIHQAKKELGLNNTELSLRMGKSKPYIAKMLNQKQSEKVQNKVIDEIDDILAFDLQCKEKAYAEAASDLSISAGYTIEEIDHNEINTGESKITPLPTTFDSAGLLNELSVLRHQNGLKDTELKETKQHLEQKTILVGKLSDQLTEAEKVHNKDLKALKDKDDQFFAIVESREQSERERDYFVNQYKQSELDVKSLKKKIIRERWIIIIVIAILTGLFFLKGAIGGWVL